LSKTCADIALLSILFQETTSSRRQSKWHPPEFPTVELHVSVAVQVAFETVEFDQSACIKRNMKMLLAQVSDASHLQKIIPVEPFYFAM